MIDLIVLTAIISSLATFAGVMIAVQKGVIGFSKTQGIREHRIKSLEARIGEMEECYVELEKFKSLRSTVCDIKVKTNQNSEALATLVERTEWMKDRFND